MVQPQSVTELAMTISLSPETQALVDAQVASGAYPSPTAFVTAAIKLLTDRESKRQEQTVRLRALLQEAVDEADRGELLDGDEVFDEILRELDERTKQS
jgi:antitoxin ParD1/3/4